MTEGAPAVEREPDSVETELKLSAAGPAPLRRLAQAPMLGPTPLGPAEKFVELDRYLDTEDRRLGAVKWACRLRSRSRMYRVSLKGPALAASELGGALHRRPEIEGPASSEPDPNDWAPSPARELLLELTGGRPLSEQLTLRQTRTQRPVGGERDRLGTLSLDRVLVVRDGEAVGRLWCVELELAGSALNAPDRATSAVLALLLTDLVATGGLVVEPLTKLERALALIGRVRS